jgi:hypothetical protein
MTCLKDPNLGHNNEFAEPGKADSRFFRNETEFFRPGGLAHFPADFAFNNGVEYLLQADVHHGYHREVA